MTNDELMPNDEARMRAAGQFLSFGSRLPRRSPVKAGHSFVIPHWSFVI